MRKVSSEAASISCIYFQQKISKNQEIRNWITVLQYQNKTKTKTKNPQKPFRAYIYVFKFNNCQARSQNNTRGCLNLLKVLRKSYYGPDTLTGKRNLLKLWN